MAVGSFMTDWTKPVEGIDGTPARVERVLPNGRAIVSWMNPAIEEIFVAVMSPTDPRIRNSAPKPLEYWLVPNPTGLSVTNVKPTQGQYIHVREVIE
jgi:hypothetical protein